MTGLASTHRQRRAAAGMTSSMRRSWPVPNPRMVTPYHGNDSQKIPARRDSFISVVTVACFISPYIGNSHPN